MRDKGGQQLPLAAQSARCPGSLGLSDVTQALSVRAAAAGPGLTAEAGGRGEAMRASRAQTGKRGALSRGEKE